MLRLRNTSINGINKFIFNNRKFLLDTCLRSYFEFSHLTHIKHKEKKFLISVIIRHQSVLIIVMKMILHTLIF